MSNGTSDEIKDANNEVAGKMKRGSGEATGSGKIKPEGDAQEAKGDAQAAAGKARDRLH